MSVFGDGVHAGGEDTVLECFFGKQLLIYQATVSHNSFPSLYQSFQGQEEKVISLLQHSVNTTGYVSADQQITLSR